MVHRHRVMGGIRAGDHIPLTREKTASAKRAGKHLGLSLKPSEKRVRAAHRRCVDTDITLATIAADQGVAPITMPAFRRYGLERA